MIDREERAYKRIAQTTRPLSNEEKRGGRALSPNEARLRSSEPLVLFRQLRFYFQEDVTRVFLFVDPVGDARGIQGWHTKNFPTRYTALQLLELWQLRDELFGDPIAWPIEAPPEPEVRKGKDGSN
jgi:hypothetical protein